MIFKTTLSLGLCLGLSLPLFAQNTGTPRPSLPSKDDYPKIVFTDKKFDYDRFWRAERAQDDSLAWGAYRLEKLTELYKSRYLVTKQNYSTLVKKAYRSLSGNEVKQGKTLTSAATVDEKSITVNLAYKLRDLEFYILPVIAARAEDNFAGLFSGGTYSRTVSIGSNFSFLPSRSSSYFQTQAKIKLHNELRVKDAEYSPTTRTAEVNYFTSKFKQLDSALNDSSKVAVTRRLLGGNIDPLDVPGVKIYKVAVDTLMGAGVLPAYFSQLNFMDQRTLLKIFNRDVRIGDVVLKRHLDGQDRKQQKGGFRRHYLNWVNFGVMANSAGHKILDANEKSLTRTENQYHVSANFSWTFVWSYEDGNRFYISPTIKYANEHNYSSDLLLKADVLGSDFAISPTLNATAIKHRIEYYADVVDQRINNYSVDVPMAWYNTQRKFGVEIGAKLTPNDLEDNKLSARVGVFVPLNPGSESQVMIQPILNFTKLDDIGKFWKDHFVFGVNLSISFPKGLFN